MLQCCATAIANATCCDLVQGKIGRDDIADLCVHLLSSKAARNATFEIKSTVPFSEPWQGPESSAGNGSGSSNARDWEALLLRAELREGVTGKTINGVYTGTQPEEDVRDAQQHKPIAA